MVSPAVFFFLVAAFFEDGWDSTLDDNHPSTTDHSWSIGTAEEPIILNPNPTYRPFQQKYFEPVKTTLRKMAENDFDSERKFNFFNQATPMRTLIDSIFYSWSRYQKEIALDNYNAKVTEDEQTTNNVDLELEGLSQTAYEATETAQHVVEVDGGVVTQAASTEEETSYDGPLYFMKRLGEAKPGTIHSSTPPEDTINSTSNKEYSFVTKLKTDRGTPGVDYPDYDDIPPTSFSCSDKPWIPGFYADLETGCQVFHVCWPDRKESFLCPVGTTFNQTLMKCEYWYNANCSMAPFFFDLNTQFRKETSMRTNSQPSTSPNGYSANSEPKKHYEAVSKHSSSAETNQSGKGFAEIDLGTEDWNEIADFLPRKAKVTVYSKSDSERESTSKMPLPLHSALNKMRVSTIQDTTRKVEDAARIVDGALGLAERVAKETAKFVMEVIKYRAKSDEKLRKAETAAKIVDETTDLATKVAKDTAWLVSNITLQAMSHKAERPADEVTPALEVNLHDDKHGSSTTPKMKREKSLEVNSRFVVKPIAAPEVSKQIQQLDLHSKNYVKDHAFELMDKSFEMVLGANIYSSTRQAILENYIKVELSKKH